MTMKTLVGGSLFDAGMFKNYLQSMISTHIDDPGNVNLDGYPLSPPATNYFFLVVYPSTKILSETWVLKGQGVCNIQLATTGGYSSVSLTQGSPSCSVLNSGSNLTVTCNANVSWRVQFQFNQIQATSTFNFLTGAGGFDGSLQGLKLCRSTDEASLDAATKPEDMWADEFINIWAALKLSVFRPMGLTNPNNGNNSQYKYIPNWKTGLYHATVHYLPGAWAGATSGTSTYTAANQPDFVSGGYVDGETIQVKFINAGSGAMTIAFGSRSAVPIFNFVGNAITTINANTIATLTYDLILGGFLFNAGGQTGVIPYELLAGFCNRVGCDYWMNFSGTVDNVSVTAITQAIRDTLNADLNAYFELGNEIWNPGGGFGMTTIANNRGIGLGFPSDNNRRIYGWYGIRLRQIMAMVTSAWAPRSTTQITRVMAVQAFGPKNGTDQFRFQGLDLASVANGGQGNATYVSYTGDANYRTVGNRPIDYSDAISYATYFSGAQLANFDASYLAFNTNLTVNGATSANPIVLQTSTAHGYTSGQRVNLGATVFTGAWTALNNVDTNVTVVDSTHFSVPIDGSGFAAYSANGGSVHRFADEMAGLVIAADNYAGGNPTQMQTALDWLDSDIRSGTNYGSASTGGSANQTLTQLATLANGTGIYPQWDTLAVTYNKKVCLYEGGFEGWYPTAATCTRLGISTSYGDAGGKIAALLIAYKNDRRFYTLVRDQMKQFFASSKSDVWAWLLLAGGSQWATMTGDLFTSTYASWDTMRLNNHSKRRLFVST